MTAMYRKDMPSTYSRFSNPDTWWDHVEALPLAFLQLLGLNVQDSDLLASIEGVRAILTIFYAFIPCNCSSNCTLLLHKD